MKRSTIQPALVAAALLVTASLAFAAETKPAAAGETKAASAPKATEKTTKPKDVKTAAKVKLVDINSAAKKELMTLPGIGDAHADKIIAGRPYLSKAHLVSQNVLSREIYEGLKALVIAKQNKAAAAKLSEIEKKR